MQISRHWRMNAQRYRLEGVRTISAGNQPQAQAGTAQTQQGHMLLTGQRARATAAR